MFTVITFGGCTGKDSLVLSPEDVEGVGGEDISQKEEGRLWGRGRYLPDKTTLLMFDTILNYF